MNDLKTTTKLVKAILEEDERARNSDSFLYFKVLKACGKKNGIDLYRMSVAAFLLDMDKLDVPGFETVRRTRQKIQQHHPELAACDRVAGMRMVNETEFRQYARGDV